MTFQKKILIGYGIIFLLMGLVVAWAVTNLVMLGKASDAILKENYRSILAAENMVDALERQDSAILLFFMGDIHQGIAQFRENEAVFLEWLARAKDNITISGETELVKALESDYTAYRRRFSELTDLRDRYEPLNGLSIYQETVYPLFIQVRKKCIDLRYLNEETMYKASIQAGTVSKQAIGSTVVVAVSALAVALVFCLVLANRIVRPLQHFMNASRRISSGDYTVRVPVETGDELGLLAGEFNRMADQIRQYHEMNIEQIISEKNKGDAILSSIEDGLLVFDTRLKVTGINPAARRMLGLTRVETALPECVDILPDPKVCDMIRKTVETGVHPDLPDEQRASLDQILNLLPVGEGRVNVTEILLDADSPVAGKFLKDIHLPKNALIAVVIRDNHPIVPRGENDLKAGDRVVLITLPENHGPVLKVFTGEKQ